MTDLILGITLITLVSTNWINVPGDIKREGGTNWVRQQQFVVTNIFVQEIVLCTNRTLYKQTSSTNGPIRWTPVQPDMPPALPGQLKP